MKASEIIKLLQTEVEKRGDLEVVLYGAYGGSSDTFEIALEKYIDKEAYKDKIWVYTEINTG